LLEAHVERDGWDVDAELMKKSSGAEDARKALEVMVVGESINFMQQEIDNVNRLQDALNNTLDVMTTPDPNDLSSSSGVMSPKSLKEISGVMRDASALRTTVLKTGQILLSDPPPTTPISLRDIQLTVLQAATNVTQDTREEDVEIIDITPSDNSLISMTPDDIEDNKFIEPEEAEDA